VDWRSAAKYTPEILTALIATGYLRSTFDRTDADITNLPQERYDVLIDLVDKVSNGVLGLSVGCARCHSHKFDPIPQKDYFRLQALFAASSPVTIPVTMPRSAWANNVRAVAINSAKELAMPLRHFMVFPLSSFATPKGMCCCESGIIIPPDARMVNLFLS
jgi:hypothetical protein